MPGRKTWKEWLWDAWCVVSIIGIWPRFIEPNLLAISQIQFPVAKLPSSFCGFKVLQFSDLHWDGKISSFFLKKIKSKINALKPDLIVFTGDLITRSKLENKEGLQKFLYSLTASSGCYAILGNHDYDSFVSLNQHGDYDIDRSQTEPVIQKGFRRLFRPAALNRKRTEAAQLVCLHPDLASVFKKSGFHLLMNETVQISKQGSAINLCGVEEYITGRLNPKQAFQNYKTELPGIVLAHNPDAVSILQHHPGDLILSGHTHGGGINLPWMWKKFCILENPSLKKGLKDYNGKKIYINRGITGLMKFRWFALPELTLITLVDKK